MVKNIKNTARGGVDLSSVQDPVHIETKSNIAFTIAQSPTSPYVLSVDTINNLFTINSDVIITGSLTTIGSSLYTDNFIELTSNNTSDVLDSGWFSKYVRSATTYYTGFARISGTGNFMLFYDSTTIPTTTVNSSNYANLILNNLTSNSLSTNSIVLTDSNKTLITQSAFTYSTTVSSASLNIITPGSGPTVNLQGNATGFAVKLNNTSILYVDNTLGQYDMYSSNSIISGSSFRFATIGNITVNNPTGTIALSFDINGYVNNPTRFNSNYLTVDNLLIDGNTISSTSGAVNITPLSGQNLVLSSFTTLNNSTTTMTVSGTITNSTLSIASGTISTSSGNLTLQPTASVNLPGLTASRIVYTDASKNLTSLSSGTATQVLHGDLTWGSVSLTADVSGILSANQGGTGQSTYTVGDILYANNTTTLTKLSAVAVGSVLISNGTNLAPSYSTSPTLTSLSIGGSYLATVPPTNGLIVQGNVSFGSSSTTSLFNVGSSNQFQINSSGIVSSGTWQGTLINPTYGGTGVNNGSLTITLANGGVDKVLTSDVSGNATWVPITSVESTLTGTANQILINGTVGIATTGDIVLTTPQDINTTSNVQFGKLGIGVASTATNRSVIIAPSLTASSGSAIASLLHGTLTASAISDVLIYNQIGLSASTILATSTFTGLTAYLNYIAANNVTKTGTGTITNIYATYIDTITSIGTNQYGLYVKAPTGGSTNIAIYGDNLSIGTSTPFTVTSSGTVSVGVWNGTVISMNYGGTGGSTTASNGGIVWSNATQMQILAGTAIANKMLFSGASTTPSWSGYTMPTALAVGDILYADTTTSIARLADVSTGSVLISGGVNTAPVWSVLSGIAVTSISGTTNQVNVSASVGSVVLSLPQSIATSSTVQFGKLGLGTSVGSNRTQIIAGSLTASSNSAINLLNYGTLTAAAISDVLVYDQIGLSTSTVIATGTYTGLSVYMNYIAGSLLTKTGTGTITTVYGTYIDAINTIGTNQYGLYIKSPTGGSVNIAIYGDNLSIGTSTPFTVTSSGTVSVGVWNGTAIGLLYGGTNNNAMVASNGGVVYSDATKLQILNGTATANLMLLSGVSSAPSWSGYSMPSTLVTGDILYASSSTVVNRLADVSIGSILTSGGVGVAPSWSVLTSVAVTSVQGTANQVLVNAGSGSPVSGAVILTLPQSIATSSNVQFNQIGIGTSPTQALEIGGTSATLYMNSGTRNTISFNMSGVNPPAFTSRSTGTKIVLYPQIDASNVDYAMGIDTSVFWHSVPQNSSVYSHKWYGGTTEQMRLNGTGLGIGTTPSFMLHIRKDAQALLGPTLFLENGAGSTNSQCNIDIATYAVGANAPPVRIAVVDIANYTASINFQTKTPSATAGGGTLTSRMYIDSTGVCIGSTGASGLFNVGSSNQFQINSSGQVTNGTWQATAVAMAYGGTGGSTTASNGGIIYSTASQMQVLAGTATARQTILSGASTTPSWSPYSLPATVATGDLIYASSPTAISNITNPGTGYVLLSGASVPAWALLSSTAVTSVQGTANQVLVNAGSGSAVTGAIILTTPQDINTTSSVQFGKLGIGVTPVSNKGVAIGPSITASSGVGMINNIYGTLTAAANSNIMSFQQIGLTSLTTLATATFTGLTYYLDYIAGSTLNKTGTGTIATIIGSYIDAIASMGTNQYSLYVKAPTGGTINTAAYTDNLDVGFGTYTPPSNGAIIKGSVGIGTLAPTNTLSVSPIQYNSGVVTATQSGNTITASSAVFTSLMVGSQFIYSNGTSAGTIRGFTSTTIITVTVSQTVASATTFYIMYNGLQVDSTGEVGIGTLNPVNMLSVSPYLYATGTAQQSASTTVTGVGTTFTTAMIGATLVYSNGTTDIITGYTSGTSITVTTSRTIGPLSFVIYYTGLQVSASTGNVGVNTIAPSSPLDVRFQGSAGVGTQIAGFGSYTAQRIQLLDEITASTLGPALHFNAGNVGRITGAGDISIVPTTASDGIGLGTNTPVSTAKVNVMGNLTYTAQFDNTTAGNGVDAMISFQSANAIAGYKASSPLNSANAMVLSTSRSMEILTTASTNIVFGTNSVQRAIIDTSGYLGINIASPLFRIHTRGEGVTGDASSTQMIHAGSDRPWVDLIKGNGSLSAITAVALNNVLGSIQFGGYYNGSSYNRSAELRAVANEAFSTATNAGTYMSIRTTPTGTATMAEVMRVGSSGGLILASGSNPSNLLDLPSGGSLTGAQIGFVAGTAAPANGLAVSGRLYVGSSTGVGSNGEPVQIVGGMSIGASASSTTGFLRIVSGGSANYIQSGLAGTSGSAGPLIFGTINASSEWARFSSGGNFSIGSTTTTSLFNVGSSAQFQINSSGVVSSGTWQGTVVGVTYGGTGSNLSSTGGTSQVLMQTSTGAAITVAQLAASNLSNGTTGSGSVVLATSPTLITPTVTGDLTVGGNLIITGGTTTTYGNDVLFGDRYLSLNSSYTTNTPVESGLIFNYSPTATATTVNGVFTAGVAATSNPTVVTTGSATFAAGDIILIVGSGIGNDGIYEVQSHVLTTLTIRGIGTVANTFSFIGNQFVSGSATGSTSITKTAVSVINCNTSGGFAVGVGSNTSSISFKNFIIDNYSTNQLLYSNASSNVSGLTSSNYGVLISNATGVPSWLSAGVTGQVLVSTTSSTPSWSTLSGIAVTSISGTSNQINASASTGSVTLSLSSTIVTPGTLSVNGALASGSVLTVTSTNMYNTWWGGTQSAVDGGSNQWNCVIIPNMSPTNGALNAFGLNATPSLIALSTKTITSAGSIYVSSNYGSNVGTITTAYGIYVTAGAGAAGTITRSYGGYFSNQSAGTTKIALYSDNLAVGYTGTAPPSNGAIINGSVGIGKSSASVALDVVGNYYLRDVAGAAGTSYGIEMATNASVPRIEFVANSTYVGGFTASTTAITMRNLTNNTGTLVFQTTTSSVTTTRMLIDNNGTVGIGTSNQFQVTSAGAITTTSTASVGGALSAGSVFSVRGAGSATGTLNLAYFGQTGAATAGNLYSIYIDKNGVDALALGINKNTTTGSVPASSAFISTWSSTGTLSIGRGDSSATISTSDIFINSTGQVGIGTTSQTQRLEIGGTSSQLYLNSATSNMIQFNTNGVAAPTFTTARSTGTKLILYPGFSNGSATDYAIGIETNTMWFSTPIASTNMYKFYGGITEWMRLDNTGLGIGTTAGFKLEVNGSAAVTTLLGRTLTQAANDTLYLGSATSNSYFFIDRPGAGGMIFGYNTAKYTGSIGVFQVYNNATDRTLAFQVTSRGSVSGSNSVYCAVNTGIFDSAPGTSLSVVGNAQIGFASGTTGPTNGLAVSGFVGINTNNPQRILHVINDTAIIRIERNTNIGVGYAGIDFTPQGTITSVNPSFGLGLYPSTAGLTLWSFDGSTNTTRMYVDTDGDIGMGTASPSGNLEVYSASASTNTSMYITSTNATRGSFLQVQNTGAGSAYLQLWALGSSYASSGYFGQNYADLTAIISNNSAALVAGTNDAVPFILGTTNTERMRIASGGNVSIGATDNVSKLFVNGTIGTCGYITNSASRPAATTARIQGEIASYGSNGSAPTPASDDGFLRLSAGGGTTAYEKTFIDITGYSTNADMFRTIMFNTGGVEKMRINNTGVGIGTRIPLSPLSVSPVFYQSIGTAVVASQTGYVVTATGGTPFASTFVGMQLIWSNGVYGGIIVSQSSTTVITVNISQTVSSQAFTVNYIGTAFDSTGDILNGITYTPSTSTIASISPFTTGFVSVSGTAATLQQTASATATGVNTNFTSAHIGMYIMYSDGVIDTIRAVNSTTSIVLNTSRTKGPLGFTLHNPGLSVQNTGQVCVGSGMGGSVLSVTGAIWSTNSYKGVINAYSTNPIATDMGGGIILGGQYHTTGVGQTEFAQIVGGKNNSTAGNFDGNMQFGVRQNGGSMVEAMRISPNLGVQIGYTVATPSASGLIVSGSVGIGVSSTSTPYKLDVQSTGNNACIRARTTTTGSANEGAIFLSRGDQTFGYAQTHYQTGTTTAWATGLRVGDANYHFYNGSSDTAVLSTTGLGIGVTPSYSLDVAGITHSALFRAGNATATYTLSQILFGWNNTNTYMHSIRTAHDAGSSTGNKLSFFMWRQGTDLSTTIGTRQVMTLQGDGYVGIGTSTPSYLLHVSGTDAQIASFQNTSTYSRVIMNGAAANGCDLIMQTAGVSKWGLVSHSDDSFGIWGADSASSRFFTVSSVGDVGISTTSPQALTTAVNLVVKGIAARTLSFISSISLDGASSVALCSGASTSDTPSIIYQKDLRFATATDAGAGGYSEKMRLTSTGFLGVGVSPSYILHVRRDATSALGPTFFLDNSGGGASAACNIDIATYAIGANAPAARIAFTDAGNHSNTINFLSKIPGVIGNALTSRLFIDSNGNICVGNTSATGMFNVGSSNQFQVSSAGAITTTSTAAIGGSLFAGSTLTVLTAGAAVAGTNAAYFGSGGTGTAGNIYSIVVDKGNTESIYIGINKNTTTGSVPATSTFISTYLSTGTISIGRGNGAGLPSNTDIFIDSTGRVGIGTASPTQKLEVAGALELSTNPSVTSDNTNAYFWNQSGVGPTIGGNAIQFMTNGNNARMTIANGGTVGINTTSTTAQLNVSATSNGVRIGDDFTADGTAPALALFGNTFVPIIKIVKSGVMSGYISTSSSGLVFNTDTVNVIDFRTGASASSTAPNTQGTSRLYINSSGNVCVGGSTAVGLFNVGSTAQFAVLSTGNPRVTTSTDYGMIINMTNTSAFIHSYTALAASMTISQVNIGCETGIAASTYNTAYFGFNYRSSGSLLNYGTLGMFAADRIVNFNASYQFAVGSCAMWNSIQLTPVVTNPTFSASQTGYTVTANGAIFAAGHVGNCIITYIDGTYGGVITGFTSTTVVSVSRSQTVSTQIFMLSYIGLQVDSTGRVGVGTMEPINPFSVQPYRYSAGGATAQQTASTTVVGVGTAFTSAMVGSLLIYNDGTVDTIATYTSATSITVTTSRTIGPIGFTVRYIGLQVASTGYVGIGATSPTVPLDVEAVSEAYALSSSAKFTYFTAGTLASVVALSNGVNSGALIDFNAYNSSGNATNVFIGAVAGSGGAGTAAHFVIGRRTGTTSWAESLRVNSSGQLGIGTNNPSQALEIGGTASQIYMNSATSNFIIYNANGVNPPSTTTRSTGTKIVLYPEVGASTTDYAIGIDGSTVWYSTSGTTGTHKWYGSTTEYMRLNNTGLGIGNITPGFRLEVNGTAAITRLVGRNTSQNANDTLYLGSSVSGQNFFLDRDNTGGTMIFGYNTTRGTGQTGMFQIYNNSTNRNLLFTVYSQGSSTGSNAIYCGANIGQGVNPPLYPLHIYNATSTAVLLRYPTNPAGDDGQTTGILFSVADTGVASTTDTYTKGGIFFDKWYSAGSGRGRLYICNNNSTASTNASKADSRITLYQTQVGIGIDTPQNHLSVCPPIYQSAGTAVVASQTGYVVTATGGTPFTAAMVGCQLSWSNALYGGIIVSYSTTTVVTVSISQTISSQAFSITYQGAQIDSTGDFMCGITYTPSTSVLAAAPFNTGAVSVAGTAATIQQTASTTVVGVNTNFTSAMIGMFIIYSDGVTDIITAHSSATSITVGTSRTKGPLGFTLHYPGLQVTNTGKVGVGTSTPAQAFVVSGNSGSNNAITSEVYPSLANIRVLRNASNAEIKTSDNTAIYFQDGTSGPVYFTGGNVSVGSSSATSQFNVGSSNQFQVTSAGAVTTSSTLTVGGSAVSGPVLTVRGGGTTTDTAQSIGYFSSGTSPTATNIYCIHVDRFAVDAMIMGVNKNSITGSIPANSPFISTYSSTSTISIGRGNGAGLPSTTDIFIGSNGNVSVGSTSATSQFNVGSSNQFQVTSAGAVTTSSTLAVGGSLFGNSAFTSNSTNRYNAIFTGTQTTVDAGPSQWTVASIATFSPSAGSTYSFAYHAGSTLAVPISQTVVNAGGLHVNLDYAGNTGTITNSCGVFVRAGGTGVGTISNAYGGYFQTPVAGINDIALYADNLAIGFTGTTPPSNGAIINGNVSIGMSTATSMFNVGTSNQFQVTSAGAITTTSTAAIGGTLSSGTRLTAIGVGSASSMINTAYFGSGVSVTAGNVYSIIVDKSGSEYLALGINKNTSSGSVPANGAFISTYNSTATISIGRGGSNGLPSNADIFIGSNGNVSVGSTSANSQFNVGTSNQFQVTSTGLVGVGATPVTGNSVTVGGTNNANIANPNGIYVNTSFSMTNSPTYTIGVQSIPTHIAASLQTISNACAMYTWNTVNTNVGTITNAIGILVDPGSAGAGTITNAYGAYIRTPAHGTNRVALFAENCAIGSTLVANSTFTSNATGPFNGYFQGTQTAVDGGSNQWGVVVVPTFSPTNGSSNSFAYYSGAVMAIPTTKTTAAAGSLFINNIYTGNAGTITNAYGVYVSAGGSTVGTITNSYGGYFTTPAAGTNKVALYTDNCAIGGTLGSGTKLTVTSPGTASGMADLANFTSGVGSTAGNLYSIYIDKNGVEALGIGINKNTTTGSVPASSTFITTFNSTASISIGRGGSNGLPSNADIFINSTGQVGIGTTSQTQKLEIGGTSSQIYLNSGTSNMLYYNANGVAVPAFTSRSVGTKIVLYPAISGSTVDHAIGVGPSINWYSIPQAVSGNSHVFYAGTTEIMRIQGNSYMGIGVSSPLAPLQINTTVSTTQTIGGIGSRMATSLLANTFSPSGFVQQMSTEWLRGSFVVASAQTCDWAAGLYVSNQYSSNVGTITTAIGIWADSGATATGTITNAYGGYFNSPQHGNSRAALYADQVVVGYTTVTTSGGTTTLTNISNQTQYFTGTSTHTVTLPVVSTLYLGYRYNINNRSTQNVTVQSSGLVGLLTIPAGYSATFTCILTSGTGAASWDVLVEGSIATTSAVSSITGTASQINASAATGAVTLSLSSTIVTPGTVAINGALQSGSALTVNSTSQYNTYLQGTMTAVDAGPNQWGLNIGTIMQPTSGSTNSFGQQISPSLIAPSTMTITNAGGLYVNNTYSSNVGTLTNIYGVYIAAGSAGAGTITNAYSIYVVPPTAAANNYAAYFGGSVGIGTATPASLLHVAGTTLVSATDTLAAQSGLQFNPTIAPSGSGTITDAAGTYILPVFTKGSIATWTRASGVYIGSYSLTAVSNYGLYVAAPTSATGSSGLANYSIVTNGKVSIGGTPTANAILYVTGDTTTTASRMLVMFAGSTTHTSTSTYYNLVSSGANVGFASGTYYNVYAGGTFFVPTSTTVSTFASYSANTYVWYSSPTGSGGITDVYGILLDSVGYSAGGTFTITNRYGIRINDFNPVGPTTVTNKYGMYIAAMASGAAASGTQYGIYIGAITGATSSTNYGIYVSALAGSGNKYAGVFLGATGVGTATPTGDFEVYSNSAAANTSMYITSTNTARGSLLQIQNSGTGTPTLQLWALGSTYAGGTYIGQNYADITAIISTGATSFVAGTNDAAPVILGTNNTERLRIDSNGNITPGTGALATNATNGFVYEETCAGQPTGVPTAFTGRAAKVYDTTNNVPWVYNGGWVAGNGQVLISKQVLGATATSVTFSSIPQVFNHLRVVYVCRVDAAAGYTNMGMRFNGDSGANYTTTIWDYSGSGGGSVLTGRTSIEYAGLTCGTSVATFPGSGTLDIPCYTNTTFYKNMNGTSGCNIYVRCATGMWSNTAAITSVTLLPPSNNFIAGSIFYLYGVY